MKTMTTSAEFSLFCNDNEGNDNKDSDKEDNDNKDRDKEDNDNKDND